MSAVLCPNWRRFPVPLSTSRGAGTGPRNWPIPPPIVDHLAAAQAAKQALSALRKTPLHRSEADGIAHKHGSRKAGIPMTGRPKSAKPRKAPDATQLTLKF